MATLSEHEHHHHEHEHEEGCCCGHHHDHEHHHEHGEGCGCGHHHDHEHHHEHGEKCGCSHHHDHEHKHEHGESCGCGHHHEHHHEHGESCGCGHHHDHEHHIHGAEKRVYILENLGCAHCAAKMEEKISTLPGVASASITYATKQLRLSAKNPDSLLPEIQKICASIESQVKVVPREETIAGGKTGVYILENLGCAHCAAKMEEQIAALPGVAAATITFATKQLRVTAENPDRYLPEIRKICTSIESQVVVKVRETRKDEKDHSDRRELMELCVGGALFLIGAIAHHMGMEGIASLAVFVIGYLILGGRILREAGRNLLQGHVFDENFLMSIATLGAFAIGEYPEALGVMLFYRVGEFFEHKAVERSRGQIMDAIDLRPEVVNLLRGETVNVIPAEDARVGDILLIRPGDRIPLDGVIVEGSSRLDTSPITGEPVPVAVDPGDSVTSGCVNQSGQLKMRVEKPLSESMVTRILDSVENAAASKPKIDRFITRFAKIYTPIVIAAAVITAIVPSLVTGDWNYWVYTALSFLVMSCPCALVLSVPLAFFSGIGVGSRQGILFKGGASIEALADLKAVVMDKTGTITQGDFKVQKVAGGHEVLQLCASCEQNSTHPIAVSIVSAAKDRKMELFTPDDLQEIPGRGIKATVDGKIILCGNAALLKDHGVELQEVEEFGSVVYVAVDKRFVGFLVISDTLKADAKSAVSRLKSQGLHTAMLTGDAESSAKAVAEQTGIHEVYAKLLPQDKLRILTELRAKHGAVMFVGDGINDAPVLAGADVGAAMGSGADAAIEAADAVFMTSSVESIPEAIAIARSTNKIAVQNVVFALAVKIAVMILGLCGYANMWMAVFADSGVAMLCVLNSIRILYKKR